MPPPAVYRCSVPQCTAAMRRAHQGDLGAFSLPVKKTELFKQWLSAIKNPRLNENSTPKEIRNARVCTRHFKPEEFQRNTLRQRIMGARRKLPATLSPTAVPSINLDEAEPAGPGEPRNPADAAEPPPAKRARRQVGNV